MERALAGVSANKIALHLGLSRRAVQVHLARLVQRRVLAKAPSGRYVEGVAFAFEGSREVATSDRYPPGPATAGGGAYMTDGKRTFTVLGQPGTFPGVDMPGFAGTTLSGAGQPARKRRNHSIKWTADGRTHELVLTHQPTTDHWGIQYLRCRPLVKKSDLGEPEADKEILWDRFTSKWVGAWAAAAKVKVDPAPRRSREIRLAYPGMAPRGVKFRTENGEADDTPEPQTLETKSERHALAFEGLPDFQRATTDNMVSLEQRMAATEDKQERLLAVANRLLKLHDVAIEAQAATLSVLVPTKPSPLPLQSSTESAYA